MASLTDITSGVIYNLHYGICLEQVTIMVDVPDNYI